MRTARLVVVVAFALSLVAVGACHRKNAPSAPTTGECSRTLPSASHATSAPPPPPEVHDSTIVVRGSVPLETLQNVLESQVPRRVAAENERPIGTPGNVTYTVDRGPFAITATATSLVAQTNLTVHATVCKPVDYVGCVQYASCDPSMRVTATVPTQLRDDWSWNGSTVTIDVTKPCLVTALDVDVTPTLAARARAEAAKVKTRIDAALPNVKDDAARGWKVAQTQIPFNGGCFALRPTDVVQGPTTIEGKDVVSRFAVISRPIVDVPCVDLPPSPPLPNLKHDPKMVDGFEMHVAVRVATSVLAEAWSGQTKGVQLGVGGDTSKATSIAVRPSMSGLALDASLAGTTCGVAFFDGGPKWDADRRVLVLDPLAPSPGDAQRFASSGADALAADLRKRLSYAPPADDVSLAKGLADLANLASAEGRTFELVVDRARHEATFAAPDGVELRFELDGNASFRAAKLNK